MQLFECAVASGCSELLLQHAEELHRRISEALGSQTQGCLKNELHMQVKDARALKKELEEAGKELVPILEGNLVDMVWGAARPQAPATKLRTHKLEFAGASVADKVQEMRSKLEGEAG